MNRYITGILFLLLFSRLSWAEQPLSYSGSFDNVRSSESGHCYGTSVTLWLKTNMEVIGLLDVHAGLCGDPPCSLLKGNIKNNIVSFKTTSPVYNELYTFTGYVINSELTGMLNKSKITLKNKSFNLPYKNINEWCAAWSKVARCSGVKEYCQ